MTYSAVINADKTFVYGEKGNENTVILTWKRTSGDYYDTLIDDCHVFSFGLDLTKLFSDVDAETAAETKLYDSVKFKIQNKTDGTWIIAKRSDEEGVYYVTGHTDKEADATVFTPVTMGKSYGHIMVKGLEEDTYSITETQTANGYTLLKNAITVTISIKENTSNTCNVYAKDVLGVLQNDPHYAFDGGEDLKLANIPQRALSHNGLTASATVDKNDVTNLWGTLHYSVVETKIIQPNDIDAIKIQPGRDLITLLTCHPYASGGRQRFLVICERMEEENGR